MRRDANSAGPEDPNHTAAISNTTTGSAAMKSGTAIDKSSKRTASRHLSGGASVRKG